MAALEICVKGAFGAPDVLGDCMSYPSLSKIIDLCFLLHQFEMCSRPVQPTGSSDPRREETSLQDSSR